ncbi:MAG TPA: hypothetical protein VLC48_09785, partial [Gemmatimonadota bacterium]|nr:hypothetical protein [Gemmatimonadota bacterium]
AWSTGGDSVYYSAESFETQPQTPGVLLQVPRGSGLADPLLINVQDAGSANDHWLVAPVADPAGQRLAFVEILTTWGPHPCPAHLFASCTPSLSEEDARIPPLAEIAVHVRNATAAGPLDGDTFIILPAPGVTIISDTVRTAIVNYYPFQRLFVDEAAASFRVSWAPDGQRLVLSDGVGLHTWAIGDSVAVPVPDTDDGAWPAWGPDGEWIAFTRLTRADSTGAICDYRGEFNVLFCLQQRTEYTDGPHVLSLIRPDGSDLRELGDGDEPAWSPDGRELFFVREDRIWKSTPDGSNAVAIPGTEGGREPAVSPDGRYLAFARRSANSDYDIWVIALEP